MSPRLRGESNNYRETFENVKWNISAAWATKHHDCTLEGIKARCGGKCCETSYCWPPTAYGGRCGWLGDNGCTLSPEDKPVGCHLYPLLLRRGLLQMHNIATMPNMVCHGNFNNGPMLIDALKDSLILLFGQDQYDRVRSSVIEGKNSYFEVPYDVAREFEQELYLEDNNLPVDRRTTRRNQNIGGF